MARTGRPAGSWSIACSRAGRGTARSESIRRNKHGRAELREGVGVSGCPGRANANLPPLVYHWLMIHAEPGRLRAAGDKRCHVVLAQAQRGREGEPGVDGQGGGDRGDDPADEHPGQDADREGGQRPGGERDLAQVEQAGRERDRVARGEERLVVPGIQHAERPGCGSHRDREQHQLGERPAPPAEALGPGVPEGAGLNLPSQHRRPDERPDQRRHRLQKDADDNRSRAVSAGEVYGAGD